MNLDYSHIANLPVSEMFDFKFNIFIFWLVLLAPCVVMMFVEASHHKDKHRVDSPDWYYTQAMFGFAFVASAVGYFLGGNWLWAAGAFAGGLIFAGVVLTIEEAFRKKHEVPEPPRPVRKKWTPPVPAANAVATVPMTVVRDCAADCDCGPECACKDCTCGA